jgi:hypothetical protein
VHVLNITRAPINELIKWQTSHKDNHIQGIIIIIILKKNRTVGFKEEKD